MTTVASKFTQAIARLRNEVAIATDDGVSDQTFEQDILAVCAEVERLREAAENWLTEATKEFGDLDDRLANGPDSFDKAEGKMREALRDDRNADYRVLQ